MKVFVTGGTGLIGRALVKRLLADGHQLTVLTRQSLDSSQVLTYINAIDDLNTRQDIVINLAGAGLALGGRGAGSHRTDRSVFGGLCVLSFV